MPKNTYTADSIDVNLGLEAVRKTPQVFLGNPDSDGVFNSAREVIDNAIDESSQREVKEKVIGVSLDDAGYLWVFDAGRGIPIERHKTTKISTLTTIMTTLSAGAKMRSGDDASYKKTRGIHGMGVSITNAMSASLEVWTCRANIWYYQAFKQGKPVTPEPIKRNPPKIPYMPNKLAQRQRGTIIKCLPDYKIFDKGSKLDAKRLRNFLRLSAYLHSDIIINCNVRQRQEVFHQPGGLMAFLHDILNKQRSEAVGKIFNYSNDAVDIAMVWSNYSDELPHSYVNGLTTADGGTHVIGLNQAISEALAPLRPKRAEYRAEDLRGGLVYIMNAKIDNPRFSTQTKEKLKTPEATEIVKQALLSELTKFFAQNKKYAQDIIARAVELRKAQQQLTISKQAAAKLRTNKSGKIFLPDKLKESQTKNPMERELFLVEGDSAGGTAGDARNKFYQEVLPVFGKVLNVHRAKPDKIFNNVPVQDIIRSIGLDIGQQADPTKKLRVGKVMLLADADSDGAHINLLMAGVLFKLLRPLIEQGRVYAVRTPLFKLEAGGKRYFGDSLKELLEHLPERQRHNANTKITRFKGLGEMQAEELEQAAFNPKTRKLIRLLVPRKPSDFRRFIGVVGAETEFRKDLLGV